MLSKIALLGVGAALALAPLSAFAQSTAPAAPGASATPAAAPSGTHRSQMQHRNNISREGARASAEHMRHMRHPAQPRPAQP